jgi:hypothetical protein
MYPLLEGRMTQGCSSRNNGDEMLPTPRTDKWFSDNNKIGLAFGDAIEFCRGLERELAEAQMAAEGRKCSEEFAVREANRLLEELNKLRLEHLSTLARIVIAWGEAEANGDMASKEVWEARVRKLKDQLAADAATDVHRHTKEAGC